MFLENTMPLKKVDVEKGVVYQHVCIADCSLKVQGEHILTDSKNLTHELDFFGADEAITNFLSENSSKEKRVATLIVRDRTLEDAKKKMNSVINEIISEFKLTNYIDKKPN